MKSLIALGFLCVSAPVFAWGYLGHSSVGEVAESLLTPQARDFVYYFSGESLAVSAVWPDQMRDAEGFNGYNDKGFASYHFVEIPNGFTYDNLPDNLKAPRSAELFISSALKILTEYSQEKPGVSKGQMLLHLKYLIHVIGDVHQPLHVGNGWDTGGNSCLVDWKSPMTGVVTRKNLHTVMDEDVFEYSQVSFQREQAVQPTGKYWFGYKQFAAMLKKKFGVPAELPPASLTEPRWHEWYQESQKLHAVIYPDKKPVQHPRDRRYCATRDPLNQDNRTEVDKAAIPVLDDVYGREAQKIAERRVYDAGVRLAAFLNVLAEEAVRLQPSKYSGAFSRFQSEAKWMIDHLVRTSL